MQILAQFTYQTRQCLHHLQRLHYHAFHPDVFDHTPSPQELPEGTGNKEWLGSIDLQKGLVKPALWATHLMDADVLLFSLNHPNSLLPHLVHDPEDVDHVVLPDSLQNPVDGNHGSWSANPSATVNNYWPLLGTNSLSECPHKPTTNTLIRY